MRTSRVFVASGATGTLGTLAGGGVVRAGGGALSSSFSSHQSPSHSEWSEKSDCQGDDSGLPGCSVPMVGRATGPASAVTVGVD